MPVLMAVGFCGIPVTSNALEPIAVEEVREAIRVHYNHGFPEKQARRFGENAVPILIEMLDDVEERPFWSNAARVLGTIGNRASVEGLVRFIGRERRGAVTVDEWISVRVAYAALGSAAEGGSDEALDYLLKRADPEWWEQQEVKWWYPLNQFKYTDRMLWRAVITGLGMTGRAEAIVVLEDTLAKKRLGDDPAEDVPHLKEALENARARAVKQ